MSAIPAILSTTEERIVALQVGEQHFRVPRNYFRHPPGRTGVNGALLVRVLLPDMEPMTEANRHIFNAAPISPEGMRVISVLYEAVTTSAEAVNRSARLRFGAGPEDAWVLDKFDSPTEETHGMRILRGQTYATGERGFDTFWSYDPEGRFVGLSCMAFPVQAPILPFCRLMVDWRGNRVLTSFDRRLHADWREIAATTISLLNGLAADGDQK